MRYNIVNQLNVLIILRKEKKEKERKTWEILRNMLQWQHVRQWHLQ